MHPDMVSGSSLGLDVIMALHICLTAAASWSSDSNMVSGDNPDPSVVSEVTDINPDPGGIRAMDSDMALCYSQGSEANMVLSGSTGPLD